MRLGGTARYHTTVTKKAEVVEAVAWSRQHQVPIIVVGEGSNIVWRDEGFDGLLVSNRIRGYSEARQDDGSVLVTIGAGERWDNVVAESVESGLMGIEALSMLPGTADATPVQNVGAYGQELTDTLVAVEAYDLSRDAFVTIPADECVLGYRTSRFNSLPDRGRFFITGLALRLWPSPPPKPFRAHAEVERIIGPVDYTYYTPGPVRDAVMQIRSHKLPDPARVPNCGSFFENPVVARSHADKLKEVYPDMPGWPTSDGQQVKIPAAWLIERAGFGDFHDVETGMGTWRNQPLVLVNEHARSTADLLKFRDRIVESVFAGAGIRLVQEPALLPVGPTTSHLVDETSAEMDRIMRRLKLNP